jgi:hypothetical protein
MEATVEHDPEYTRHHYTHVPVIRTGIPYRIRLPSSPDQPYSNTPIYTGGESLVIPDTNRFVRPETFWLGIKGPTGVDSLRMSTDYGEQDS